MTSCLSKVTIHSLLHNFPIEMIIEGRLSNISACFAWLEKICNGIWAWCVDTIVWVQARLMVLHEESLSVTYFTITTFHHYKYTCYQYVLVQAMLIILNDFELSTYVLTEKSWIGSLNYLRPNNTLITFIYLCCVDTWKKTVYVYPRLLFMCLCVPVLVDLQICRIKSVYQTLKLARMAARFNHAKCRNLQRRKRLALRYRSASTTIRGLQLWWLQYPIRVLNVKHESLPLFLYV